MLNTVAFLVTNNPLAKSKADKNLRIEFLDTDLLGVLIYVRGLIHKGHHLLTHPLSGSIKPNESPYKSILISEEHLKTDPRSVEIIEEAIQTTRKFPQKDIPEIYLNDLQTIDFSFISEHIKEHQPQIYNTEQKPASLLAECTSGGCGAKIGPGELSSLLGKLPQLHNEHLMVGFDASDDAAVYIQGDGRAVISTVDFFSPMVDDPYIFGQIAAANALSDIYAMGGTPVLALNLVCFPEKLSKLILADILTGGADKITEAGAVLGGGHSIYDKETKYGLAVTGFADKDSIIRNNTPEAGHSLILTKPLGVGIILAAERASAAAPAAVQKAVDSMRRLNRYAAEKMRGYKISACTDVTGFGLFCHLLEMCGDTVSAEIQRSELPYFPEAAAYAEDYMLTAAGQRNRNHFAGNGMVDKLPFALQELVFDPQTSGGLLICVDPDQAPGLLEDIQRDDPAARMIGKIIPKQDKTIIIKE